MFRLLSLTVVFERSRCFDVNYDVYTLFDVDRRRSWAVGSSRWIVSSSRRHVSEMTREIWLPGNDDSSNGNLNRYRPEHVRQVLKEWRRRCRPCSADMICGRPP